MAESFLKRSLPRGIYGRAALFLLVPVVTIQFVVSVVFLQRHFEDVTRQMMATVIRDIRLVEHDPTQSVQLGVLLDAGSPPSENTKLWYDLSGQFVMQEMAAAFPGLSGVDLATNNDNIRFGLPGQTQAWSVSRSRGSASNPHQLLVLMVFTAFVMTVVAILFLRNQVRPIRRLARAAEAFGRGQNIAYSPTGATEVRAAGQAFLDMRDRIERQIEQRTLLLSGVSHDLRTPLTRMRLELSMMDEETVEGLNRDVAEMQRMIDAFLDFARENAREAPEPVSANAMALQVVENFTRMGQIADLTLPEISPQIPLRPIGVVRALENLLKNAFRYGESVALTLSYPTTNSVSFTVEDDGPGIPEAERAAATQPFTRLDSARTKGEGSVGLGLAIVTDVVRAHGGTLTLDTSPGLGGLRARMVFPQ